MTDPATVSRLADETGIPLADMQRLCDDAERKPGVSNPVALARTWGHGLKARRDREAAAAASRPQPDSSASAASRRDNPEPFQRADPEVARAALAQIRAILDGVDCA